MHQTDDTLLLLLLGQQRRVANGVRVNTTSEWEGLARLDSVGAPRCCEEQCVELVRFGLDAFPVVPWNSSNLIL